MKTFSINTLGCKVNQYETQQIRQLIEGLGLIQQPHTQANCDLTVINTCCVTNTASSKSRQYIRKAQKHNPDAYIVVCGCLTALKSEKTAKLGKKVVIIEHRNNLKPTLTQIINTANAKPNDQYGHNIAIRPKKSPKIKLKKFTNPPKLPILTSFKGQTRAFLKVQDGCDAYCSYCIIPKTRPFVQSRPIEHILAEAKELVRSGHKEIVITGIFLGAYGQNTTRRRKWASKHNHQLLTLLQKLSKVPGLERIRLSSLEPGDVTKQLLKIIAENQNIMPHIHLSLQSGSDNILKKMARQYRRDTFLETVEMIKEYLDTPALTTDIIVGFPGESDEDFEQTLDLTKRVEFSKIHVFAFSLRNGTAAAKMTPLIDHKTIKQRSKILRQLNESLAFDFRSRFIGGFDNVLTENHKGSIIARSERYFIVFFEDDTKNLKNNQLLKVRYTGNNQKGMIAEIINNKVPVAV